MGSQDQKCPSIKVLLFKLMRFCLFARNVKKGTREKIRKYHWPTFSHVTHHRLEASIMPGPSPRSARHNEHYVYFQIAKLRGSLPDKGTAYGQCVADLRPQTNAAALVFNLSWKYACRTENSRSHPPPVPRLPKDRGEKCQKDFTLALPIRRLKWKYSPRKFDKTPYIACFTDKDTKNCSKNSPVP